MKRAAGEAQRGFTLMELAVVLTIIAVVTGMSASMSISVIETAHLTATQKKMKAIDDALLQYRTINDRLPCPGDLTLAQGSADFGLEAGADAGSAIAPGTGVCTGTGMLPQANFTGAGVTNTWQTAAEGAVPAVTLGLSPDFMLDGWGHRFRYAVDISYTAKGSFTLNATNCINGAITVNDGSGNARSSGSIYALISHGANGHGAYTPSGGTVNASSTSADELTNCHCNSSGVTTTSSGVQTTKPATYVQKTESYDSGHAGNTLYNFDDLVSYKERWQMRADWDNTKKGCAYAYVTDGWNRIETFTLNGVYLNQFTWGNGPFQIAMDASGNLVVSDAWVNYAMTKMDTSGNFLSQFGYEWFGVTGNGNFDEGDSLRFAMDAQGNFWVPDSNNNLVEKFDSNGNWLFSIGGGSSNSCTTSPPGSPSACTAGTGNGQFNGPSAIAIDHSGNVWVTDEGNNRVQEFSSTGTYITSIGAGYNGAGGSVGDCSGSNGQFCDPKGLAFDQSGYLWVVDYSNCRVNKFNTSTLSYVSQLGCASGACSCTGSVTPGQFGAPVSVAVDPTGNIWVGDRWPNIDIQEFTSSGTWIRIIGGVGNNPGQFSGEPDGIAFGGR